MPPGKMDTLRSLGCVFLVALLLFFTACVNKKETTVHWTGSKEAASTSTFSNPSTMSSSTATLVKPMDRKANVTGAEKIGNTSAAPESGSDDNSSILDAVLNTIDQSGSGVNESDDELDKLMDEIDKM